MQCAYSKTRFASQGMALMEVMAALVIGGILSGYTQSGNRAEWAGFNFAAQSLAAERFEQTLDVDEIDL